MKTKFKKDKVNIITLGCSKNLVDSEVLSGQLAAADIDVKHESKKLDYNIVVVNTCGFIDLAKEESINTILEQVELKKRGKLDKVYVTGCLSERYKQNLETEIPEVDAFFGTMELPFLLRKFNVDYKAELVGERLLSTPNHYAYLKISEGCNYGLDIYKKRELPKLLHALADIPGLEWIRLHYAYPSKFPMEIIDAMKERKNICNYLDMPLQHASNRMLASMRRQITREEMEDIIGEIKSKIPEICIRTTLIAGFPGETLEDVEELETFLRKMRFDRVGTFTYSHEENTIAHNLIDDVPAEEKDRRAQEIMDVQQEISYQKNEEKIGKTFKVIIDKKEAGKYIGRTEFDSVEVDNEVIVNSTSQLIIGDFVNVQITGAFDYDLEGMVV